MSCKSYDPDQINFCISKTVIFRKLSLYEKHLHEQVSKYRH